ncbi:MAG: hypothetical protein IPP14_09775 [Planctomycetes bacterium]|nr:hypothetical protein [Planctomycetota bacterium]
MRNLVIVGALALSLAFAGAAFAQGGGGGAGGGGAGGGGGGGGGGGKWPGSQSKQQPQAPQPGQGGGQGGQGGNWEKDQIDKIGWGESGDEVRVLPGQTVPDKEKDERLEKEADKLGLEDKKVRANFKKGAKKAWDESEREDKRWGDIYKRLGDDAKKKEEETKKHLEKLGKIWEDSDADLKKKEILDDPKIEDWKKNSADLRKETATDKSARQDEIRARKIQEIRDAAAKWVKGQAGGSEDPKVKKEKKDEETKEPAKPTKEKKAEEAPKEDSTAGDK